MLTQDTTEKARYKDKEKKAEESARKADATHIHEFFAFAVTIFQVATTTSGIRFRRQ